MCVVDDDPALLEIIRDTLKAYPEYIMVGSFTTAEALLAKLPTVRPDLFIVDFKLPGMTGLDLIRALHDRSPAGRFLLITGYLHELRPEHDAQLRHVRGCLAKPFHPAELISTLDLVARGAFVWPMAFQALLLSDPEAQRKILWHPQLSRRENEIMALLSASPALLDQELADKLHISKESVRTHLTHIFHKFNVHRREDALRAFRQRIK